MGRYKSVLMAQRDARSFPFHVDVNVPPLGLGKQIDVMTAWLDKRIGADWRCHGKQEAGVHVARYMFRTQSDADAFGAALAAGLPAP